MSPRCSLLLAVLLCLPVLHAQEVPPLTEADGWNTSLLGSITGTQAAYANWTAGGVNSLAATANLTGQAARVLGSFKQTHDLKLALGALKQDTLDYRKALDEVRYALAVEYLGTGHWRPTFAAELRTQLLAGFEYDRTKTLPASLPFDADGTRKISDLFAPGYVSQVLGVTYDRGSFYKVRLGMGLKETIVGVTRLRPLYGNALDQQVRVEGGPDVLIESTKEIVTNVIWTSRLNSFYSIQQLDQAPDTAWENRFALKVNDWLHVNIDATALFDADQSRDLQFRQGLGIGVSFSLL